MFVISELSNIQSIGSFVNCWFSANCYRSDFLWWWSYVTCNAICEQCLALFSLLIKCDTMIRFRFLHLRPCTGTRGFDDRLLILTYENLGKKGSFGKLKCPSPPALLATFTVTGDVTDGKQCPSSYYYSSKVIVKTNLKVNNNNSNTVYLIKRPC